MRARQLLTGLCTTAALTLLAACGGGGDAGDSGSGDERLGLVATVSPLTNIVANVAGGEANVRGIVPEGESSHEYEPAPSVARVLANADVIFINGLNLETPTKDLAEGNLKDGAEIVELGNRTIDEDEYVFDFSFPEDRGDPNPHLWTNPLYVKRYAEIVRDTLVRRDPDNAEAYRDNSAKLAEQIDELDRALEEATDTVPRDRRKLVTYHDSFPYFAREYEWTVVGAVQPSDFSDPTPREVAGLIEQVREEEVPAVFGSEIFPSPVLKQIAKESGAEYIDDLRDDDLPGKPGDENHSLLALLQFDYTTIVDALGGQSAALREVETGNPVGDDADYPQ